MNPEYMKITDEDFSSVFSFKKGSLNVDYASMLLLYGYFNGRDNWYDTIKSVENMDFEYRSYVEFSRGLFNQLFDLIKEYNLIDTKDKRVALINNMKVVSSQINSFCKANSLGVTLGDALNELTDGMLNNDNHMNIWSTVIRPLQDDAISLKQQEESYYKYFKQNVNNRKELITNELPYEVRNAHTDIVDMVKDKEEYIKAFYDRVNILFAYQGLVLAIDHNDPRQIADAHNKLLEQCVFVNECNASPFYGDLRPRFTFTHQKALIEYIKFGDADIEAELINVDMFAKGNKTKELSELKEKCQKYIESTIATSRMLGLISEDFKLDNFFNTNFETEEKTEEPLGPSL